jgi:hypothetical protein
MTGTLVVAAVLVGLLLAIWLAANVSAARQARQLAAWAATAGWVPASDRLPPLPFPAIVVQAFAIPGAIYAKGRLPPVSMYNGPRPLRIVAVPLGHQPPTRYRVTVRVWRPLGARPHVRAGWTEAPTGHPVFDRLYRLETSDPATARALLTPERVGWYLDRGLQCWTVDGPWLITWTAGITVPEHIPAYCEASIGLAHDLA